MFSYIQKFCQLGQGSVILLIVYIIDAFIQIEGIAGGKIPPQLIFLPHDNGEPPLKLIFPFPWNITVYGYISGGRVQDTGQDL